MIYYRPLDAGVLIVEILHKAQDPARDFEEEICNRISNSVARDDQREPFPSCLASSDRRQTM